MMRKLLWIDCIGAALNGVVVLALSRWLGELYGLPRALLLYIGVVNCVYACYSFTLAVRAARATYLIAILVCANLAWSAVCLFLALRYFETATIFGNAHLFGEAGLVATLAAFEWRYRDQRR